MDPNTVGVVIGVAFATAITTFLATWPVISARIRKARAAAAELAVEAKTEASAELQSAVKNEVEQAQLSFQEKYTADAYERDRRQREADAERIAKREQRIEKLEASMEDLLDQREADAAKIAGMEEQIDAARRAELRLQGEIDTLTRRVDELVRENKRLAAERDAGKAREHDLAQRVQGQQAEIADLQKRIVALEAEKAVYERLLDRLQLVKVEVAPDEATVEPAPDVTETVEIEAAGEAAD